MFQLDDKFLADIGLDSMPEDQKKPFIQHIYNELELRVGTRLSEGMSEAQLYYRVRPSVYAFVKLCTRLLEHTEHVPLTPQERETILLYTRKLVERFL